jgi:hypothetical protein
MGFSRTLFNLTLLSVLSLSASAAVVDGVNAAASNDSSTWNATEVGWFYTPTFSYNLTGIETKFGSFVDSRTVTVEVYTDSPGSGGMLLRSADFTALANAFSGGFFAPLSLTSGTTYFIGFRNVGNFNVNLTNDTGATNLPGGLLYSFDNNGSYSIGPETLFTAQPILQFHDDSAVPEPSTWVLGLSAAALLLRFRHRS